MYLDVLVPGRWSWAKALGPCVTRRRPDASALPWAPALCPAVQMGSGSWSRARPTTGPTAPGSLIWKRSDGERCQQHLMPYFPRQSRCSRTAWR